MAKLVWYSNCTSVRDVTEMERKKKNVFKWLYELRSCKWM